MIQSGSYYTLPVVKMVDFGAYLDGGTEGEILLPKRYVPKGLQAGDTLEVFIYHDGEGRLIATTERPKGTVGDIVVLEVKDTMHQGAFLEWGLIKDLFLPLSQQTNVLYKGMHIPVLIYRDEQTGRVAATQKFQHQLKGNEVSLKENDAVNLLVTRETELGFEVIVNAVHVGLIHFSDIFYEMKVGERLKGFVKRVLPEGKLDIMPGERGYKRIENETEKILRLLSENSGYLPFYDKSSPEEIYDFFGMSKKTFKMAVGNLYKAGKISLAQAGIQLIDG
ncbi:MAG TPA: S1-like domain-containing RNA-binding protein [Chitinophagaceae bacterium]|nr:S1-like domain-containing RNA-binding protein [Chitinophagaceae bacterium]